MVRGREEGETHPLARRDRFRGEREVGGEEVGEEVGEGGGVEGEEEEEEEGLGEESRLEAREGEGGRAGEEGGE